MAKDRLSAIPTNIITGFLGVGKTTAISHLLKQKPKHERWAILVNEFGEVGIDGSLFQGEKLSEQGVFISEVPGGCMCCASGLPMQIALNMLLARARPDRLIIEPTGLGHPKEVMEVLSAKHYRDVLRLHSTITLIDARKLNDLRYTENDTFNQQLDIADVIVANKKDLYGERDLLKLIRYLGGQFVDHVKPIFPVSQGQIDISWLTGSSEWLLAHEMAESNGCNASASTHQDSSTADHPTSGLSTFADSDFNNQGFTSISNQGEGYFSKGWVFKPEIVFDKQKINSLLLDIDTERAKGLFITKEGILGFNKADDVLTAINLDESLDSRIELIARDQSTLQTFETTLLGCIA